MKQFRRKIDDVLLPLLQGHTSVAVFDFPNYANVGDSAIWLGQNYFLQQNGIRRVHVDDCYLAGRGYPTLSRDVFILINGGGNFGDLYLHHQKLREALIREYPENRIIQLPQSIYFQTIEEEKRCADFLRLHSDFHLVVRDEVSLDIATRIHQGPIHLCPDMALYLGELSRPVSAKVDVMGLLRTDREQVFEHGEADENSLFSDWLDENKNIGKTVGVVSRGERKFLGGSSKVLRKQVFDWAARLRLRRGCRLLASGRVVVTDRLHAHILCTMMGQPHVVLDNSYGKITNFREAWGTGGDGLCLSANSFSEALVLAKTMS